MRPRNPLITPCMNTIEGSRAFERCLHGRTNVCRLFSTGTPFLSCRKWHENSEERRWDAKYVEFAKDANWHVVFVPLSILIFTAIHQIYD